MKPSLTVEQQVDLLTQRGLGIEDPDECAAFLRSTNYYRFSGYARYFQQAPHLGDNTFKQNTSFAVIREIYDDDERLRSSLAGRLAQAELVLRTHVARAIADDDRYGPYRHYLDEGFYTSIGDADSTVETCLRDIERSRERHILRYRTPQGGLPRFSDLPIWPAVEAWSFGTLSKCIERGAQGSLSDAVARNMGMARQGFAYRVRALVYLRNRCAHHSRLWNHSIIDSGPTPNNVRAKAKRLAGQFEPRSALDVIASLDDILARGASREPLLPELVRNDRHKAAFWEGLSRPQEPRDHRS